MALIRAQVNLRHINGLPEDVAINTFHFSTADILSTTLTAIVDAIEDFYITAGGAAPALYTFFSANQDDQGNEIKLYNLDDPEPRVPIFTVALTLPAQPSGDPLPGEVAMCCSFQATPESGEIQARRRGRVFVGRLDKDCSSAGRPTSSLVDSLVQQGAALLAASDASAVWSWIVFSRAHTSSPSDPRPSYAQSFAVVEEGWVDNAFDTQRRRGLAPTERETF
jgi:hypothetical protein